MALQGTLDTFELPDLLRLLASTKKTGRLRLQTDRGDGSVWVDTGRVVSVVSPGVLPASDQSEALFDLLRSKEGSFVFHSDELADDPVAPSDVEPLLAAAEERLLEWREIEKVVPSMYAHVRLAEELPAPEVTIDAAAWKTVTAIGSGVTVDELGRSLDLSEVGVCRLVRELVELGLGTVSDGAPASVPPAADWSADTGDRFQPIQFHDDPVPAPAPAPQVEPADASPTADAPLVDPTAQISFDPDELRKDFESEPLASVTQLHGDDSSGVIADMDDDEADEVARQLAKLSPRAAQAVAAAAAAETQAERDAALEALDETDDTVNRSLLLKFLGSVKG